MTRPIGTAVPVIPRQTRPAARIAVSEPDLGPLEERYVLEAVRSGWVSSIGPFVERFESGFAAFCAVEHGLACANGTVAVHLALAALGVGPGDEVIVPSMTFVATANAVSYCGATPVFADVDDTTWCLDPQAVADAVTPRTRAVVAVHLYGHPADMTALQEICRPRGIALVEDAAQAHGATWHGRPVGGLGDIGTFSFFGNKILTTGEGGMVTTGSPDLAARVRLLRGQAMDPERRYWFTELGYNYRLTNIAAALGVAQLQRADELIAGRDAVAAAYDHHLAGAERIRTPVSAPGARRVAWCYTVALPDDGTGAMRDGVARKLAAAGIDTRPTFIPLHVMPVHRRDLVLPVTERAGRTGISLPTHAKLSEGDVARISTVLIDAVDRLGRRGGHAL